MFEGWYALIPLVTLALGYIVGFEIGNRRGRDRTLNQWRKSEEIRQERRRAGYD